ncbi:ATP-dependent RNA helicase [Venturia nashicola]|uniref:ATP-dependent RNA helicase n=1 Tax=Venturia nashicola TaxID=86259 RepID=A0A4Z1P163_9PEZI|nr:ATP-dependent RNA helicase [Venturia nashicola]TLD26209.1 ATP-dependent RNA helicase [Venturia nashicola]
MLRREPTKIKLDQNDIARYDESKQQRTQEQFQNSQFTETSFEGSGSGKPADQNARGGRTKEQRILGNASGR